MTRRPRRKRRPAAPVYQDGTGRDGRGRFAPGVSGNPAGRPRGIDFRETIHEHAEAEGFPLPEAVYRVFRAILKAAEAGDVQAAKWLTDRLCGPQAESVELHVEPVGPPVPEGAGLFEWAGKLAELAQQHAGPRQHAATAPPIAENGRATSASSDAGDVPPTEPAKRVLR